MTTTPAPFSPIAGGHAIAEIVLAIHFASEFTAQQVSRLRELRAMVQDDLPGTDEFRSIKFKVEGQKLQVESSADELEGVGFFKAAPDGTKLYALQARAQVLQFSILDYRGWTNTLAMIERLLCPFARALIDSGADVDQIALRCLDVFEYTGDAESYSVDDLFLESSAYVAGIVRSAGPLWHCNSGWFANQAASRTLVGLNLSGIRNSAGKYQVHVDHIQQRQLAADDVSQGASIAADPGRLLDLANEYYDKNKELMRLLLSTPMLARIGIQSDVKA